MLEPDFAGSKITLLVFTSSAIVFGFIRVGSVEDALTDVDRCGLPRMGF